MRHFYFDHNATTPVSEAVMEAYLPVFREVFGNASSVHHFGQEARRLLEEARERVARMMGCGSKEIIFTSGGTEANNLAILGTVRQAKTHRPHVITSSIEHPAVLATCERAVKEGAEVTIVPVSSAGVVDPDDVRKAVRAETVLISVMHVNNEVGTVQPLAEIAGIAQQAGVRFHSDGVQAIGKIPVSMMQPGIDMYSISGHKFFAPKGVGALFVRHGTGLTPVQFGGSQERGHRPGTSNVPGAVGMGVAAQEVANRVLGEMGRISRLRNRLEEGILEKIADTGVNGVGAFRAPNTANICFDGLDGEALLIALDLRGFAVSSGAACSSGTVKPSHVLTAMGLSKQRARASIRFSLGPSNTEDEVSELIRETAAAVEHLRRLKPSTAYDA